MYAIQIFSLHSKNIVVWENIVNWTQYLCCFPWPIQLAMWVRAEREHSLIYILSSKFILEINKLVQKSLCGFLIWTCKLILILIIYSCVSMFLMDYFTTILVFNNGYSKRKNNNYSICLYAFYFILNCWNGTEIFA